MFERGGFSSARYNFDGLLSHVSTEGSASSYVQFFSNGIVEAVLADVKNPEQSGHRYIPIKWMEQHLIKALPTYLRA
jgi:hypothetical protein